MLGNTVVIGEIVCWGGILLCSRTFHWVEDSIWVIHAAEMLYYSNTPMQMFVYGFFVVYVSGVHLPRQFKKLKPINDCKIYRGTKVKTPEKGNRAW